jgi:hypothetical protein
MRRLAHHILYSGDEVTGLIDYGGVKTDHVAVDLSRLLGSLIEDDDDAWVAGIAAYGEVASWDPHVVPLARLLDETGTLLGAANWLLWLDRPERRFDDRARAAARLGTLVRRLERWETISSLTGPLAAAARFP